MSTPSSSDTPPQTVYYDSQNYEIDINKMYTDWIVPIEDIRSNSGLNPFNKDLVNHLNTTTFKVTDLYAKVQIDKSVQESRCHAFYRFIGLPVVSASGSFFNPGFDIINCAGRTFTTDAKIQIVKAQDKKFQALSEERERYYLNFNSVFATTTTIDASVLGLSSGGTQKLRLFNSPFNKSADPTDYNTTNQQYDVNHIALVGATKKGSNNKDLINFKDASGNSPKNTSLFTQRKHIIKPFVVDGRIDFIVSPQTKLVSVPFVRDNNDLKVSATTNVIRPYLERVIRDRLNINDETKTAGTNINNLLSYFSDDPTIKQDSLLKLVANKKLYKTDQVRFTDNVNAIRTMIVKLVDSQRIIRAVQSRYYFVPVFASNGPEGGGKVQGVFPPQNIGADLVTNLDKAIFTAIAKDAMDKISGLGVAEKDKPVFVTNTTFASNSAPLGDNNSVNKDTLATDRSNQMSKAIDALRTVEIIMGEFSGLGLCDVVAMVSALNIIDTKDLLGLLDDDAWSRMKNDSSMASAKDAERTGSVTAALASLTTTVQQFYTLMDEIYKNYDSKWGQVTT
jgi:hypothetical protein